MKPLNTSAAQRRAELEKQTAAFLAKGGEVEVLSTIRTAHIRPWTGTDIEARRVLSSASELCANFRMSEEKFLMLTKERSFPAPYLFRAEPKWSREDVKAWHTKWRGMR